MLFNLIFADSTIFSCFFLNYGLILFISGSYYPVATNELVNTKVMSTKRAKAETETQPVKVETKISKCSIQFKVLYNLFCAFYLTTH